MSSLLAKLSSKKDPEICPEEQKLKEFKKQEKLLPLIVVQNEEGEDIEFLKLNFGSHYIEFKLNAVVQGGATMLELFQFYLEILNEDAHVSESGCIIWRNVSFVASSLFGDPQKGKATFTLFCPEPPAPLFLWKEKK